MRALAIALVLGFSVSASAEDWSKYIDHSPHAATPAKAKAKTTPPHASAAKHAKAPAAKQPANARAAKKPRRK